ncbi:MAG: hypothetical protein EOP40_13735 [Rubrivivax sp.]|nr:MAG: hypothetical protein EOP40_13735 [Rubrivivax sp.]
MSSDPRTPTHSDGLPGDEPPEPIGSAHMREDGIVELRLVATAPGAILGEALFLLKPDDPRYQGVVDHLGGLTRGGYAPVPPFPPGVF